MKKNDLKMIYSGIMYTFSLNISSIHLMYLRCRHIGSDRNEVFEEAIRVKSDPNIPTIMKQWPCRRKPRPSLMMMDGVHLVGRSQLAAEACKMDAKLQTALANLSSIANQFGLLGASTQSNAFEFNKQKKKTLGGQRNKSRPLHLVDGTRFLLFVCFFFIYVVFNGHLFVDSTRVVDNSVVFHFGVGFSRDPKTMTPPPSHPFPSHSPLP